MDSSKLNDWLQVVGLFGVMASMVFVGLQIKQDHDIALADAYQARTATLVEAFNARAANTEALSAELRVRGINPNDPVKRPSLHIPESAGVLTELEYRAGILTALATWQQWSNIHYQNEMGFMPDDNWLRLRSGIKRNFAEKELAAKVYNSFSWRPTFRRDIDEIIAEVESEKSE
jgi:hypothetical protein